MSEIFDAWKGKRKKVQIEVVGPLHQGYCNCRRCGGKSQVFGIMGVGMGSPTYWECKDCGLGEVVMGTPMQFGEVISMNDDLHNLILESYIAYREEVGLPIPKKWIKKLKRK